MFGYVTVNADELTAEEKRRFASLYCGVCAALGEAGGLKARMTLSFDAAFLALTLSALYEPKEKQTEFVCPVHPFKKHYKAESEVTRYAADVNVLLSYYGLLDGWRDDGSRLKLLASKALKSRFEAARCRLPDKAEKIKTELDALSELEKGGVCDIDAAAGCFGRLLGAVFAYKDDIWAPALYKMGLSLGRFIYLLDAWDDAEKDEKKGAYNPLKALRHEPDYEKKIYAILTAEISDCAAQFEKLPITDDIGIIRNVLYSGVWTAYSRGKARSKEKTVK